jgi:hypothetical protein
VSTVSGGGSMKEESYSVIKRNNLDSDLKLTERPILGFRD